MRFSRISVAAGAVAITVLSFVPADAHQRGKQKKPKNATPEARVLDRDTRSTVAVHVAWGSRDVEVIRAHYAPQYRGRRLPPGLAKKYARTGQLPPGWQKKMQPMPVVLESQLPPLPPDHHRGVIEGVAVIYDPHGLIIDVAVLF